MSERDPSTSTPDVHRDGNGRPDSPRNFLEQIVEGHLQQGTHGGRVVTRFPPEPNGYLHLGHAKAITVNFGLARRYGGRCHLRMDDTNPTTEETEYVESIQDDVRWLGGEWGEHFYYASDYFERLYELAIVLIDKGLAFVDDESVDEIREHRGTIKVAGTPSRNRDRSVAENRDLFARMRAGEFPDGSRVLRAKIDMSAANILMRDPLMYRIRHAHHHRTGDKWCIYPMYDYAHGLSDAIEGITHSICTLEFENNRDLYDWFVANTGIQPVPRQYEFARLNVDYTVLSKRRLIQLAQDQLTGWDDPRMPTIAGLRRRGIRAEALRAFCEDVGVTKTNSMVDVGRLESCIRDDLNHLVPRVMAVVDPLELVIETYPEGEGEVFDAALYPHDHPLEGTRAVPFTRTLYIERDDFAVDPPKGWHRLAPGVEVRLRYAYFVTCTGFDTDADGKVIRVRASHDPASRKGEAADGRKVKGTLHWVSATRSLPAEFRLYDRLFTAPAPGDRTGDYLDDLNPESLVVRPGFIEPSVAAEAQGSRYQFERVGYFIGDVKDCAPDHLVFNRIVTLRDSWAKQTKVEAPVAEAPTQAGLAEAAARRAEKARPGKRTKTHIRAANREADAVLAARFDAWQTELGLDGEQADLLTGDRGLSDLFEAAAAAYAGPLFELVKWTTNILVGAVGEADFATLPFDGGAFARLVALVDAGEISLRAAKDVLAELVAKGGEPTEIVDRLGLRAEADAGTLDTLIAQVFEAQADFVARFRAGETKLLGFLIGQVMQASGGKADPKAARAAVVAALGAG